MMAAKRFSFVSDSDGLAGMTEDSEGEWVHYEDYMLIREKLAEANDELMEASEHD
jgi:hypothetical protein